LEKVTIQKLALLCVSTALCSGVLWWDTDKEADPRIQRLPEPPSAEVTQEIKAVVCVSGAVVNPGMYQVTKGSRAREAIQLAGGVTEEADMDRVNLAQVCKDGGHIRVPRLSQARLKRIKSESQALNAQHTPERKSGSCPAVQKTTEAGGVAESVPDKTLAGRNTPAAGVITQGETGMIHLNSAGEEELKQLPGVGSSTARRIVTYRENYGFRCVEDIMKVPGIGPAKFAMMKARLTL